MIDPFGRHISYLRVSVTDRCDFRCVYCMAEEMTFLPKADLLTLEELDRLCSAFVRRGTRKLRITGGEPLLRVNLPDLIADLNTIPGVEDIALTTNGVLLAKHAYELKAAGLSSQEITDDADDLAGALKRVNQVGDQIVRLAEAEGFAAHAEAVRLRLQDYRSKP